MRLDKVSIDGFKNLRRLELDFDERQLTTVLIGQNGAGKSNLIEAITQVFRWVDLRRNEPHYATQPNIMKDKKKPLETVTPDALGVDVAPRLATLKVQEPAARSAGVMVADVAQLVDKLKNEAKVI